MSNLPIDTWELHLQQLAAELPYPPTPDIVRQVVQRTSQERVQPAANRYRAVWVALGVIVLLLAGMLLVPPVRAAVLDFLQLGAVRIFLVELTPTATHLPTGATTPQVASLAAATLRPQPTPTDLVSWLDLGGEITFSQAVEKFAFPISLPLYPQDLDPPDRSFLQEEAGQVLILVWTDPNEAEIVGMSLQIISPGSWIVTKMGPEIILETRVNSRPAFWAVGPYPLELSSRKVEVRHLVAGNVLIWEQDGLTYRLESSLPMEEAIKIAESLQRVSTPAISTPP